MRVVLLCNNWTGWQVTRWLKQRHESIVAVVVHAPGEARHRDDIIRDSGVGPACVFDAGQIHDRAVLAAIRALGPDMAVSVYFGRILGAEFRELFPAGCINVHPAYLPFNRGAYPNVWSIVEGTPAGATIHYIDEGIDTGDIIAQRRVAVDIADTGESLYRKLERACVDLFVETWPSIADGSADRVAQDPDAGSAHRRSNVGVLDVIDLERCYRAGELIDLLRARTFPPHRGAYFVHNGRRVYLRLSLETEQDAEVTSHGRRDSHQPATCSAG